MLVYVPGFIIARGLMPGHYDGLVSHRDVPAPLHRFVVTRNSRAVGVSGFVTPLAAIVQDRYKLVVTFEDGLRPRGRSGASGTT